LRHFNLFLLSVNRSLFQIRRFLPILSL
jgi:hypothetical protein